ncbi:MAG: VapC toxin family PIN domain ribonuclease [Verrucomicrobia bacterium]|nr:VapC toxin family PIN domain ribonuclease [Verrucomicrobiota bacterium]
MHSLDTNILLYAMNADCPEHQQALTVMEEMLRAPSQWIIADQVLLEYYRLVRNPAVLAQPLDATTAACQIQYFREKAGCAHCSYETAMWPRLSSLLQSPSFPARRTFDAVLAVTLKAHGVKRLFTRNVADFEPLGWFEVVDPIE